MVNVNKNRIQLRLDALAKYGIDECGGWSRPSYTEEYRKAYDMVREWMEEVGMTVRSDSAGNLFGRLEGEAEGLPVVAAGSHIDTVKNGGKFDGNAGVVAALEVMQIITENHIQHKYPLEVIVFVEEEGSRFGTGLFGSRAMLGEISSEFLREKTDKGGITIAQALTNWGLDPGRIDEAKVEKGYYKAYFELHIEQGSVLDSLGIPIGIVEGIAAPVWLKVTLKGRADHAGATPMNLRRDAFLVAAELALAGEGIANSIGRSTVVTVGKISVKPGGANIVPGEVELFFDVRNIEVKWRTEAIIKIMDVAKEICTRRDVSYEFEEVMKVDPCILPDSITSIVEEGAKETGARYHRMVSGAGHDAQLMAKITDVGMIFTPSINGLSHCPEEDTDIEDITICTQALLNSMLKVIS